MKIFIPILTSLLLFGCATSEPMNIIAHQAKIVKPDDTLYNCPTVKSFPNPDKLTDIQVARLIVQLHKNNVMCKNSLDGIKKFLDDAEKTVN